MHLNRINVSREGYYSGGYYPSDPTKGFRATVELAGDSGKVELNLGADVSGRIVALLADEIARAGRATAEAMVAETFSGLALAKIAPQSVEA